MRLAFGIYARVKSRNIEYCNLIVYLIIIMLVVPRSIKLNTLSMLKTNNLVQFVPIPNLHSEVTPKISKLTFHNLFIII